MLKFPRVLICTGSVAVVMAGPVMAERVGLGRPAMDDEIAAWDLDVRPDGTGLPFGAGDVLTGEEIFADKCAICHGDFAEGVGNWPKLAGGMDTLDHDDPLKTIGSFWPYLSTTWDYVNRSMPFGNAQSLSDDEVYAIVAYILYSNDLVEEDFVLSNETFSDVEMPNVGGFILDDRAKTEWTIFSGEPCMQNCKDTVEITMRARVLDVTPDKDEAVVPVLVAVEDAAVPEPIAIEPASVDPALVAAGEKVFRKCKACHQVGEGAENRTGPVLTGIVGSMAGQAEGFKYSKPMQDSAGFGLIWNATELTAFLTKPRAYMKGTRMAFSGLRKERDIAAVIAYLRAASE